MNAVHGLLAIFPDEERFVEGLKKTRERGYSRLESYLPYPAEESVGLLDHPPSPVPKAMAIGGVCSGVFAFALQAYAARDYPLNVGGRPLFSWPSFVPITFELTVLGAALTGVVALLILARLPRLDHPVLDSTGFREFGSDRFLLCVRSDDPLFEAAPLRVFLRSVGAESVQEVPA